MKSTFSVLALVLVLLAGVVAGYYLSTRSQPYGNDGLTVSPTPTPIADDLIVVEKPLPGSLISSPLKVTGRARGTWYFEASFPIVLKDANGKVIAQTPAQARGEWMTTDFVPFEATLTFTTDSKSGTLIFQKDNASGLPENDDSREMTVWF